MTIFHNGKYRIQSIHFFSSDRTTSLSPKQYQQFLEETMATLTLMKLTLVVLALSVTMAMDNPELDPQLEVRQFIPLMCRRCTGQEYIPQCCRYNRRCCSKYHNLLKNINFHFVINYSDWKCKLIEQICKCARGAGGLHFIHVTHSAVELDLGDAAVSNIHPTLKLTEMVDPHNWNIVWNLNILGDPAIRHAQSPITPTMGSTYSTYITRPGTIRPSGSSYGKGTTMAYGSITKSTSPYGPK